MTSCNYVQMVAPTVSGVQIFHSNCESRKSASQKRNSLRRKAQRLQKQLEKRDRQAEFRSKAVETVDSMSTYLTPKVCFTLSLVLRNYSCTASC
jgi:hypothetical protein